MAPEFDHLNDALDEATVPIVAELRARLEVTPSEKDWVAIDTALDVFTSAQWESTDFVQDTLFGIAKTAARSLRIQADVRNLTDQLTVINFAGLFSGTALAPPRSLAVRLRADF